MLPLQQLPLPTLTTMTNLLAFKKRVQRYDIFLKHTNIIVFNDEIIACSNKITYLCSDNLECGRPSPQPKQIGKTDLLCALYTLTNQSPDNNHENDSSFICCDVSGSVLELHHHTSHHGIRPHPDRSAYHTGGSNNHIRCTCHHYHYRPDCSSSAYNHRHTSQFGDERHLPLPRP